MFERLWRSWFYRWWAVNRATIADPYTRWEASFDFTLFGEAGQELVNINDRAGPFHSREQADEVAARMNSAALAGGTQKPAAESPVPAIAQVALEAA